ncbi:hypothetical protein CJD36_009645 [Flavipsychrobacter stenotrophus]|uniref:Uncharacterized protein n=1 Tax=Flavipsychrobacter stenotrophus TaxID=2077091 RepID=A0A2S7SZK3_9BACT|nr:hypothetical protein CJD36_009645 [Flavipsychrobacter stenotrophus]
MYRELWRTHPKENRPDGCWSETDNGRGAQNEYVQCETASFLPMTGFLHPKTTSVETQLCVSTTDRLPGRKGTKTNTSSANVAVRGPHRDIRAGYISKRTDPMVVGQKTNNGGFKH